MRRESNAIADREARIAELGQRVIELEGILRAVTDLSLGGATQRAMAGPEIPHNEAGVPITTKTPKQPGIRFHMNGIEFFPFGPEPFGVLKLEIDSLYVFRGSPETKLHIRSTAEKEEKCPDCGYKYKTEKVYGVLTRCTNRDCGDWLDFATADVLQEPTDDVVEAVLAESVCASVLHPRLSGDELRSAVRKLIHAAMVAQKERE